MRVVVLVSTVPANLDYARLDKATGRVEYDGARVLNPFDVFPLSEALRLAEDPGATVELMAAMTEPQEDGLREALALVGERAHVLTGPHVASTDGVGLGLAFAAALRGLGDVDAVLLAGRSPDPRWGLVAGSLSEALDRPLALEASDLRPGAKWTAEATHGSERWRVEVAAPLVATVSDRVARRFPTAWSVKDAVAKEILARPLHELDADGTLMPRLAAKAVSKRHALEKSTRGEPERFTDDPEDGARLVVRRLRNRGAWPEAGA